MYPRTVKEHWNNVAATGCIISGQPHPTIHHCHGGSMRGVWSSPGMARKQNDALVIPLAAEYHVGRWGIDNGMGEFHGVEDWEAACGKQVDLLTELGGKLGYDPFKLARLWEETPPKRGR